MTAAFRMSRPLQGFRILDLTMALSGPYATLILGGLGAEVIHIEAPGGSDFARTNPPFVGAGGVNFGAQQDAEVSLTILNRARNKKSITLDLKSDKGHEMFMALAKQCDVVIENMSEGTVARLKVDYENVKLANPRIVYASITSLGDPSLYPGLKGMDIIVQALSGLMSVTGFADGPPTRIGVPVADLLAPLFAVNGIMAALLYRSRTGEGQHVSVSMLDCLASWVAEEHFDVLAQAGFPMRTGNSLDRIAPFGVYACSDGHVAIIAVQPQWVTALFEAMGRPELSQDPRFDGRGPRSRNAGELNALIQAWTGGLDAATILHELFDLRGIPCARVRTPHEMLADPRLHESGAIMNLEHPALGKLDAVGMGLPIHFSKCAAQFDQPATDIGSANEQVYGDLLGLRPRELDLLRADGVI